MTAELVRGQNHPLSQARLEIRVSAGKPIVAGGHARRRAGQRSRRRVGGPPRRAHAARPRGLPAGRGRPPARGGPGRAARGPCTGSACCSRCRRGAGGPVRFGAVAAPFVAVTGLDGTEIASYTITGLDAESAVVALELYRRQGAWKVRAVGQGYAGGLAELLADQGAAAGRASSPAEIDDAVAQGLARSVPRRHRPARPDGHGRDAERPATAPRHRPAVRGAAGPPARRPVPGSAVRRAGSPGAPAPPTGAAARSRPQPGTAADPRRRPAARSTTATRAGRTPRRPPPAPTAPPAAPGQPAQPVAGDATGWSMEERLYNQVWGMFEDLARDRGRLPQRRRLRRVPHGAGAGPALSDPRSRIGGPGDAAREAAQRQARRARRPGPRGARPGPRPARRRGRGGRARAAAPRTPRWDNPVWHALPGAHGDAHGAAPRRPASARERRAAHPDAGPAAAGARPVDRQRTAGPSTAARRLRRAAPTRHGHGGGASPPGCSPSIRRASSPCTSSTRPARAPRRSRRWCGPACSRAPPAAGAAGVAGVLARLTQRVDLVQMAVRGGAADALPPGPRHRRAAADRQRLPARLRRPGRDPAALSRGRGPGRRAST